MVRGEKWFIINLLDKEKNTLAIAKAWGGNGMKQAQVRNKKVMKGSKKRAVKYATTGKSSGPLLQKRPTTSNPPNSLQSFTTALHAWRRAWRTSRLQGPWRDKRKMTSKLIKIQQSHAINVSYKQVEDLRIIHIKKVIIRLPLGLKIHRMHKNKIFSIRISVHLRLFAHHTSTIHYFTNQQLRN